MILYVKTTLMCIGSCAVFGAGSGVDEVLLVPVILFLTLVVEPDRSSFFLWFFNALDIAEQLKSCLVCEQKTWRISHLAIYNDAAMALLNQSRHAHSSAICEHGENHRLCILLNLLTPHPNCHSESANQQSRRLVRMLLFLRLNAWDFEVRHIESGH